MTDNVQRPCGDCGVLPGEFHVSGCDVERCPRCGGQRIGCDCVHEVCGIDVDSMEELRPDIFRNGPTPEMYAMWDVEWGKRRIPWSGEWPGKAECREYGLWCRTVPGMAGWQPCRKEDEGATEDLNTLIMTCRWDVDSARWVKGNHRPLSDQVPGVR